MSARGSVGTGWCSEKLDSGCCYLHKGCGSRHQEQEHVTICSEPLLPAEPCSKDAESGVRHGVSFQVLRFSLG